MKSNVVDMEKARIQKRIQDDWLEWANAWRTLREAAEVDMICFDCDQVTRTCSTWTCPACGGLLEELE